MLIKAGFDSHAVKGRELSEFGCRLSISNCNELRGFAKNIHFFIEDRAILINGGPLMLKYRHFLANFGE